jgi:hypothetical protein
LWEGFACIPSFRKTQGLSSIWDPNSMASPAYCLDEETQQNGG